MATQTLCAFDIWRGPWGKCKCTLAFWNAEKNLVVYYTLCFT